MGEDSKIEWCDNTFNPWMGCQSVSPGCDHCYAEDMMDTRYGRVQWGPHGDRKRTSEGYWKKPIRWNKETWAKHGRRARVFCASLADIFDNHKSIDALWREQLWSLIRRTPSLDWLLLTKRPQNFERFLPDKFAERYPNVWLGVSVEDQERANLRIPILLDTPASTRFISYEPALGPVDLNRLRSTGVGPFGSGHFECWQSCLSGRAFNLWADGNVDVPKLDLVIFGGESGSKARPVDAEWARSARDQCAESGVAFFMKQMDKKQPIPPDLLIREWPK